MNKKKNIDFACEQLVNIVHGEVTRIFSTGEIIKKYGIEIEKKGILELDAAGEKRNPGDYNGIEICNLCNSLLWK